ncbi:hypothetical protein MKX01_021244 [Papaver californicum]|nr:hypothetical protein MKX01_021244 [Papaver californicum]
MFDAMVGLNFSGIPIVVTETGWPSLGGANEHDATMQNANRNLFRRVLSDLGTPSQPSTPISTYIYELFNEDKRPGPISEKNWGIFFPNGTTVYSLCMSTSDLTDVPLGSGLFCVAKPDADSSALNFGLDWTYGQGSANCSAVQARQPCFQPNNIQAILPMPTMIISIECRVLVGPVTLVAMVRAYSWEVLGQI